MAAKDFHCPKCSQLNTTIRTTCKNCGIDLKRALGGIEPMQKSIIDSALAFIFKVFIVIVILGILSAVALPKFANIEGSAKLSSARAVGSAVSASIQVEHSDFLTNAVAYTMADCLARTSFTGGITYNTTPNNTPAMGEICSNVGRTKIMCNVKGNTFGWTWTPQVGNTQALIVEDSATAFP